MTPPPHVDDDKSQSLQDDLNQMVPSQPNMPWWIRAITLFGVPAAIALFLVWELTISQAQALGVVKEELMKHNQFSIQTEASQSITQQQMLDSYTRIENYLRMVCINTAKTPADQANCLSVR